MKIKKLPRVIILLSTALLLTIALPVSVAAAGSVTPLTITVDTSTWTIKGNIATGEETALMYAIVDKSMAKKISDWDNTTDKATVESGLGVQLTTEPMITESDSGKYVVVVELLNNGGTVVAAGEAYIANVFKMIPETLQGMAIGLPGVFAVLAVFYAAIRLLMLRVDKKTEE